jgi:UDP-glucose 4-epimerase
MRIVVIGGAGFVGGHVVDRLQKAGHDVVIADFRESRWHPSAIFQKVDVMDDRSLLIAFDGAQVVLNLAAISNTQAALADPVRCYDVNVGGAIRVFDAARKAGVERVMVAGSTLISGMARPIGDDVDPHEPVVRESDPIKVDRAYHPYVSSKVALELAAKDFARAFGLETTVFRYGIQYGERMTPGVVAHAFIENALAGRPLRVDGDGSQWRQYTYVGDIADAHVAMIDRWEESANETFHIARAERVQIIDIAEEVSKQIKGTEIVFGPPRPGDIDVRMCSVEKAKEVLGWEAQTSLSEGIEKTVGWYKSHLASGVRRRR